MKRHERARAHPTRDARCDARASLGRVARASARLFLLSMGHDSSPSPSPTTDRITRARAPWSLSAGRFVPWPPASASPPASIAHKKYPPIVSHRTESHRASRRRASSPFVNPSRIQRIIESSSSYLSLGANDRARRARGLRRPAKRTKKKSSVSRRRHRTVSSVARASRSTDPTPRSRSREGPDRYARARPPWEKCARGRPRERRGARATHLTANTARVDIVCASMARGRRVVRTRARARGRRARDGIEAIDARWARVWVLVGGVCSCVEGLRS